MSAHRRVAEETGQARMTESMRNNVARFLNFFLIAFLCICSYAFAEQPRPAEYEVKAAFIYNLAKFIEWPPDKNTNLKLCILGEDPFGSSIKAVNGKQVGDKTVIVSNIKSIGQSKNCQILFISNSEKENLPQIVDAIKNSSILTIGDTEGFAKHGVIFNFYLEQDKVRFEINPEASNKARLKISSKILKLGRIIKE